MSAHSGPLLGNGGEWILNIVKRNPEGLLLLAAGPITDAADCPLWVNTRVRYTQMFSDTELSVLNLS